MKKRMVLSGVFVAVLLLLVLPLLTGALRNSPTPSTPVGSAPPAREPGPCDFEKTCVSSGWKWAFGTAAERPVAVIHSVQELQAYCEENEVIGLESACAKYDDAYFAQQILVIVVQEEGSSSICHEVESVELTADNTLDIAIRKTIPEFCLDNLGMCHILIEPEAGVTVESAADVQLFVDGKRAYRLNVAEVSRDYARMSLRVPENWEYETVELDDNGDFGIDFWPAGQTEGRLQLRLCVNEPEPSLPLGFSEVSAQLSCHDAYMGPYDHFQKRYAGGVVWDYLRFEGTTGNYIVRNAGAEVWWEEYGDQAMKILNEITFDKGIIEKAQALAMTRELVRSYTEEASFDFTQGVWSVRCYKDALVAIVRIDAEGNLLEVVQTEE